MFTDSVTENILFFISGLGILQGFLLAALIYYHPKSDRSVNRFLSLHIITLSVILAMPFVLKWLPWQKTFFLEPLPLFLGPFLYLYIRSFKEKISWKIGLTHLIFPFIYYFGAKYFVEDLISHYKDDVFLPKALMTHPLSLSLFGVRMIQYVLYYYLSRQTLLKYQRSIRQIYSDTSNIDLEWIKWLLNGLMLLILVSLAAYSFMVQYPKFFGVLILMNVGVATPYIYMATVKGMRQLTLWQKQPSEQENVSQKMHEAEEIEEKMEKKQTLPAVDEKTAGMNARIIAILEKDKLYTEPELTLQNLADKLGMPSYQVSQCINEGLKKNFYDLVNGYRVEEAKRLLVDPKNKNFTILSVGFEAGFNSKTTFNTVFKKFTGMTPTDYREKQKSSAPAA